MATEKKTTKKTVKKTTAAKPAVKKPSAAKPAAAKPAAPKALKPAVKKAAVKASASEPKEKISQERFYAMVSEAAYFSAQNDGNRKSSTAYWLDAEAAVRTRFNVA